MVGERVGLAPGFGGVSSFETWVGVSLPNIDRIQVESEDGIRHILSSMQGAWIVAPVFVTKGALVAPVTS